MPEPIRITLRYVGKDVDDGSMPINDVIVALQGFAGAYGKIASRIDPHHHHEIRVADINKSSFAVVILAWLSEHKEIADSFASAAALFAATLIIKLIEFKKENKGKEPTVEINGDGNTVLVVHGGTQLVVPKELLPDLKSGGINGELAKIAKPLEDSKIDRAELSTIDGAGHVERTEILVSDKQYFQTEDSTTTTSKPGIKVKGELISLNKDKNRGTFRLLNGDTVGYHLCGPNPSRMYPDFAKKGPVEVECTATFDEDLQVRGLEITSIRALQIPLGFDSSHCRSGVCIPPWHRAAYEHYGQVPMP